MVGARGTTLDELLVLLDAASLDDLTESVRRAMEVGLADESASGQPARGLCLRRLARRDAHAEAGLGGLSHRRRRDLQGRHAGHQLSEAEFNMQPEKSINDINNWGSKVTN